MFGEEIAISIDHALLQDATGILAMLEFEAMEFGGVKIELAAQYVDHNLLQTDHKNADDHKHLQGACSKYGIMFSAPGNGVSHQIHMERFGVPGKTMLGADSHTPGAAGLLHARHRGGRAGRGPGARRQAVLFPVPKSTRHQAYRETAGVEPA